MAGPQTTQLCPGRFGRLSLCLAIVLASSISQTLAQQQATSLPINAQSGLRAEISNDELISSKRRLQIRLIDDEDKSSRAQRARKCTRQSINLARQMLVHELEHINNFNAMWFSDLDRGELLEGQKESLSNIVASGYGTRLLHPDGQPLIEIESSYFRNQHGTNYNNATNSKPLSIRLVRRHHDRCSLSSDGSHFSYMFALSLGPIEHHLDVLYNLPKELSLGQPLDWRYGQLTIKVPKMIYELTLKQAANYKLDSSSCPLDIGEVVYLLPSSTLPAVSGQEAQSQSNKPQLSISTAGLALNNQTIVQLERLFDDYTRPITTRRLRQMLRFYLNSKTLPLSAVCNDDYC